MMRLIPAAGAPRLCAGLDECLPERLDFDFHGSRFGVAASSGSVLERLGRVNAYFRSSPAKQARRMVLAEAGSPAWTQLADTLDAPQADPSGHVLLADWFPFALQIRDATLLHYYSSKLLRLGVAEAHRDHSVTLHAASLEAPDGGGLLMVGEAASGKTSTTIDLLELGFRFLSDDTSCIRREDLACLPFPTAFVIRADLETGQPNAPGLAGKPPDIGLLDEPRWLWECWDKVGSPVTPSLLLFLGADLAPGTVRPIPASDAALRLLANVVVPLGADPARAIGDFADLDVLARLAEGAQCFEANAADRSLLTRWIARQTAPAATPLSRAI